MANLATINNNILADSGIDPLSLIVGTGTVNYVPKFTAEDTVANSQIFDNGTNIGIGTTSPVTKLDIFGPSNDSTSYGILTLRNSSNGGISFGASTSSYAWIQANVYGNTYNLNLILNAQGGNVGIGTLSPVYKLQVNSVAGNYGIVNTNGTVIVGTYIEGSNTYASFGTQSNHPLGFFTNNNAPQMYITTAGNVGIGTTSPGTRLVVQQSADNAIGFSVTNPTGRASVFGYSSTFQLDIGSSTNDNIRYGNFGAGSGVLSFLNNGSEAMRITSGGNVLIGSTTNEAGSKLYVLNSITTDYSGTIGMRYNVSGQTNSYYKGMTGTALDNSTARGLHIFNYDADSNVGIQFWSNARPGSGTTPQVIITSSGNVGIGTTSPTTYSGYSTLALNGTNGGALEFQLSGTQQARISNAGGANLQFVTNNAEAMRITSAGNVGIGTSSPAGKLEIVGSSGGLSLKLPSGEWYGASSTNRMAFDNPNQLFHTGGSGGAYKFRNAADGADVMTITNTGNVGIGTTSPATTLDVRGNAQVKPSTGTDAVWNRASNDSGEFYLGIDNSAGSGFTGTAYARFLYATNFYPMTFHTNNSERMRLDASGNLLVGTTSNATSAKAVIERSSGTTDFGDNNATLFLSAGAATTTANLLRFSGAIVKALVFGRAINADDFIWAFTNSSTPVMRLDASGNLGLGVTPSAWNSAYKAIQFGTTGTLFGESGDAAIFLSSNGFVDAGGGFKYITTDFATAYTQENGVHTWKIAPSGTAGNAISFTQAMTLDASGRLGIGTTTITAPLTVAGTSDLAWSASTSKLQISRSGTVARMQNYENGSAASLALQWEGGNVGIGTTSPTRTLSVHSSSGPNFELVRTGFGGYTYIEDDGSNSIYRSSGATIFQTGGTSERMRITSGGNVGIGTSSPGYKLEVVGNIQVTGSQGLFRVRTDVDGRVDILGQNGYAAFIYFGEVGAADRGVLGYATGSGDLVYRSGANAISNGTERLRVKSTGAVQFNAYGSGSFTGTRAYDLSVDASGNIIEVPVGAGTVTGSGTTNYIPKWTSSSAIGNSIMQESGSTISVEGNVHIRSNNVLQLFNSDNTNGFQLYNSGASGSTGANLIFLSSAVGERMRLDASGNLGLGNSSPSTFNQSVTAPHMVIGAGSNAAGVTLYSGTTNQSSLNFAIGTTTTQQYDGGLIYVPNAGSPYLAIRVNGGVERARIDASGNLGLGTSSPAYKLDVVGSGKFSGNINFGNTGEHYLQNDASTTFIGLNFDSPYIRFATSNSERMRLDASGNLGLGVTPSAWNTVTAFQVGSTSVGGYSNTGYLNANAFYQTGWKYINSSYSARYEINASDAGEHRWFTAPSGTAGTAISFTQAMTLDASGNLLVGATSITQARGGSTTRQLVKLGSGQYYLEIQANTTSTTAGLLFSDGNGGDYGLVDYTNSDNMLFYTASAERMRITSGGNVGIGTTAPNHQLAVYAGGARTATTALNAGNSNTIPAIAIQSGGDAWASSQNGFAYYYNATNGNLDLYRKDNSTTENQVMTWVRASGNVGIGTTSPGAKLEIVGSDENVLKLKNSSAQPSLVRFNDTSTSSDPYVGSYGNALAFGIYGVGESMRISSSRNLLVGTTIDNGYRFNVYQSNSNLTSTITWLRNAYNNYDANPTVTYPILSLTRDGKTGITYASTAAFGISRWENSSVYARTQLDIKLGHDATSETDMTVMSLRSNGNVGIGTTSPDNLLTLYNASSPIYSQWVQSGTGTGSTDGLRIGLDASSNGIINLNESTSLITSVDGSERMRINSGGDIWFKGVSSSTGYEAAFENSNSIFSIYGSRYGGTGKAITLWATGSSESMRINYTNNVLIGTTTDAGYKLDVNGTGRFSGSVTATQGIFRNSGVPAIQVIRDLNVVSVGTAGQGIEFGALNGSTPTAGAAIYGTLDNPATTGALIFQTLNAGSLGTRMYINNAGNVGIGTTSPTFPLDIRGNVNVQSTTTAQLFLQSNSGGYLSSINVGGTGNGLGYTSGEMYFANSSNAIIFNTKASSGESMRITSGGNVGIGISSPTAILHTAGNTKLGGGTLQVSTDQSFNTSYSYTFRDAVGINNPNSQSAATATTVMSIGSMSNGVSLITTANIGIGTTSPDLSDWSAAANGLQINDDTWAALKLTGSTGKLFVASGASANFIYGYNAVDLVFGTNNTERMRITSGGNLLVGTTTDAGYKFDVAGSLRNTTSSYFATSSGSVGIGTTSPDASTKLQVESSSSSSLRVVSSALSGGDLYLTSVNSGSESRIDKQGTAGPLTFYNNGSERMRLTSGGELLINTTTDAGAYYLQVNGDVYASAYYESSDLRLKNVLSERKGSDGINTIAFKWKDGRDSLTHIGYAAQQVEKVLPDAVKTNPNGYKTINYDEVQSLKIANLEQEIAELKKIIKQLIDKK